MTHRVSWEQYFMQIAEQVATRSTCERKFVGAVIVRDKMILSTGYNGSIRGLPHCEEAGHEMENGHCIRTVHAEANAILKVARTTNNAYGATLYLTHSPCKDCSKLVLQAGIKRLVYMEAYKDRSGLDFLEKAGLKIQQIADPTA